MSQDQELAIWEDENLSGSGKYAGVEMPTFPYKRGDVIPATNRLSAMLAYRQAMLTKRFQINTFSDVGDGGQVPAVGVNVEPFDDAVRVIMGDGGMDNPNLFIERDSHGFWRIFVHPHDGDAVYMLRMYDGGRVVVHRADDGKTLADSEDTDE